MKKIILLIIGILILGGAVYAYTQLNEGVDQPSSASQETINLMGIEMTEQQAIEHCQLMPDMDGCAPFLK